MQAAGVLLVVAVLPVPTGRPTPLSLNVAAEHPVIPPAEVTANAAEPAAQYANGDDEFVLPVGAEYVTGELIVGFSSDASPAERLRARASAGAVSHPDGPSLGPDAELITVPRGGDLEATAERLLASPDVAYVEANYVLRLAEVSNDPLVMRGDTWGLYGAGSAPSNEFGSNAVGAWARGFTGSDAVAVVVIDGPVDIDHPDLADNIWTNPLESAGSPGVDDDGNGYVDDLHGWDFVNGDGNVRPMTASDSHGTHVAGTIGAVGGNGVGVAGVSWDVTIIAAQAFESGVGTLVDAIEAIDYATTLRTRLGVEVVATNNSWIGPDSRSLQAAIRRGGDAGVLFVAAAGNFGTDNDNAEQPWIYPSSYDCSTSLRSWDCVIAVAALDRSGALAGFSNYGKSSVDLAAPGDDIFSTVPSGSYGVKAGTSMATPHVTGAIALCASIARSQSMQQLRDAVLSTAVPTASLAGRVATGARLDVGSLAPVCEANRRSFTPRQVGFDAVAYYTDRINLSWSEAGLGEYGQEIQYAIGPRGCAGEFLHKAYIGPGLTTYPLKDLVESSMYCFRMRQYRNSEVGPWSYSNMEITWSSNLPFISGRVLLADGTPVANATVGWLDADDAADSWSGTVRRLSDENGEYVLQVAPGAGELFVVTPRTARLRGTALGFPSPELPYSMRVGGGMTAGDEDVVRDLTLPPFRRVEFQVMDAYSLEPVAGVSVSDPSRRWYPCDTSGQSSLGNWNYRLFPGATMTRDGDFWCHFFWGGATAVSGADGRASLVMVGPALFREPITFTAKHPLDPARIASVAVQPDDTATTYSFVLPGTPSRPERPSATPDGTEITLSWEEPWDGGAYIDYYRVSISTERDANYLPVTSGSCAGEVPATARSCTVTGLTPGVTYYFAIIAHNVVGYGPSATLAVSMPTVPSPPRDVILQPGDGVLEVSWTPPVVDGGLPIKGYTAVAEPGGQSCTTSTTSCVISGLTNGVSYTATVTASNKSGSSELSLVSEPAVPRLRHVLTVSRSGTGSGTVTSSLAGVDCGSSCSASYVSGTSVTLSATADVSSTFTGWSGTGISCAGTGSCTVSMTAARSVTAMFALKTYALTVAKAGTGTGTVTSNPVGVSCGATCSFSFGHGTSVTLSATPSSGSVFSGWSGTGVSCAGTGSCTVSMTAAASVTATFTLLPTVTALSAPSGGRGLSVTVMGTGFVGVSAVTFNGVSAPFTVLSATSLVTSVPTGATTGPIRVVTPAGTAASASFTVGTTAVVPTVTAYSTNIVRPGAATVVTLTGTNLAGVTSAALNGVTLSGITVLSPTSITVTVPASGVSSGPIRVTTAGGTSTNMNVLTVNPAPTSVAAGGSHTCARLSDGTARCWGLNTSSQLGDGTVTQRNTQVAVLSAAATPLKDISSIAAGGSHSCALLSTGAVRCWGSNVNGQLGVGNTTGLAFASTAVTGITTATQVTAGSSHTCVRLSDGTARCWGLNANGQLGNGTTTQATAPVTVLSAAGTTLTGVVSISAGANHTCAVLTSGAARCWGANTSGQLGTGSTAALSYASTNVLTAAATLLTGVSSISAGNAYTCAVMSAGTARCWGSNTSGQRGVGTTTSSSYASGNVLSAAGVNLTGITSIAAGSRHACAVLSSGGARCWGANTNGQRSVGSTTASSFASAAATGVSGSLSVAAGSGHSVFLGSSTTLAAVIRAAGLNINGQLGDNTTTQRTAAVLALV